MGGGANPDGSEVWLIWSLKECLWSRKNTQHDQFKARDLALDQAVCDNVLKSFKEAQYLARGAWMRLDWDGAL